MATDKLRPGSLFSYLRAEQLKKQTGQLGADANGQPTQAEPVGWLDNLKAELEAKRQAEAEAQYRKDALIARLMFELSRVRAVELLEEMNRELVNSEGRVEPIYTDRHELCFSWPVAGGRNQITVGADFDDEQNKPVLLVTGQDSQRFPVDAEMLKTALIEAFRQPDFNVYRW